MIGLPSQGTSERGGGAPPWCRRALRCIPIPLAAAAVAAAVALVGGPASADTASYRSVVLADSPSGYWRLGDSGAGAADETGANPGTYVGGVTLGRPGAIVGDADTAAGFNGTTGTVQIANSASLNPSSAISLEAWVRVTALPASAATIVRKDGQYALRLKSNGALVFRLWKGGVAQDAVTSSGALAIGAWTHVVGTWDGSTMTAYVNGTARASATLSGPIDLATSRFWLGSTYNSFEYIAADLDEVAVYPTALSAARVQAHYQNGSQTQPQPDPQPAPQTPYSSAVVSDGPKAYWRLGDTGTTTAADQTGAYPGSYVGGVTLGRPGAVAGDANTAAGFDGASGTVKVPSAAALSPTAALSLETWIRPTAFPSSSNTILRKDGQYALRLRSNGAVLLRLWQGGVAQDVTSPAGAVALGAWSHVVGTWDGATMTIYVNGVAKASASLSGPIDSAASSLYLASTYNSFDWFTGDLDEVAFYDKALPAARVLAHYQLGAPPPPPPAPALSPYASMVVGDGPASYWRLGDTGASAADQMGAAAGTYVGGVTRGRPGAIANDTDGAAGFDGLSGTVSVPSSSALSPTGAISLEGWIRPTSLPTSSNSIVRKDGQYSLALNYDGSLTFRLWKDGAANALNSPLKAVTPGTWTHVAATWDGSTMTIYVNGAAKASTGLAAPISTGGSGLYFGSTYNSFAWFAGDLDELAVYPKALSAARVAAHYSAGAPTDTTSPVVSLSTPAAASTMDATPAFGGTGGTAGGDSSQVTVSIYAGSSASGTAIQTLTASVDAGGIFSVKAQSALAGGTYTAVAAQSDSAGNVGRSTVTFGVDASADPKLIAAGDIARCGGSGDEATGQLLNSLPGTVAAVGDLAYESGTALEFLNCYDPSWGTQRARTSPAVGNHEYESTNAAPYFAYFGAAAGDPAKGYYSYSLGSWHIIALNSECAQVGGCGAGSPQEQWLQADLLAHPGSCTLAYFHEPRFSSGEHGDNSDYLAFWQDLYTSGADVVLSGHDHMYERFAPQAPDGTADPANGIREFVVGSGGGSHGYVSTIQPNSEVRDASTYGVLSLTLHPGGYDWRFVPAAGGTFTDSGSQSCH